MYYLLPIVQSKTNCMPGGKRKKHANVRVFSGSTCDTASQGCWLVAMCGLSQGRQVEMAVDVVQ